MHPNDIHNCGLSEGSLCRVQSDSGEMGGVTISAYPEIRQGCVAMYYPESNVLVPKGVDPLSRTPSYKRVAVKIVNDESLSLIESSSENIPTVAAGTPRQKMTQC